MSYKIIVTFIIGISLLLASCETKIKKENNVKIESVKIGTQIWMQRNLDVDHYRNGDSIPEVRDSAIWSKLRTGAWCYYNNDLANGKIYGKLYNWYAVNDSRGLAPKGWHVPDYEEWTELEDSLGGWKIAGGKLKEKDTLNWLKPNTGATNESGFTALPGGCRLESGKFFFIGKHGKWWSSTMKDSITVRYRNLLYDYDDFYNFWADKEFGFSVRCVKN